MIKTSLKNNNNPCVLNIPKCLDIIVIDNCPIIKYNKNIDK